VPEQNKNTDKPILTLRNARDVIVICLIGVVTWKLINADFNISIKEFSFTDLLSMFVSFFAIALSIAFYFKATETSNRFYDNSYTFTKDVSEILGRIEAGFGEKLKHIDEGYAGIKERIDLLPFDASKAKEEIKVEEQEIENKKKEQNDLLESFAKKAKLVQVEKDELFSKMEKTNKELDSAKDDLRRMQKNMLEHESLNADPHLRRRAMKYLADKVDSEIPQGLDGPVSRRVLYNIFENIKHELHDDAINDLHSTGIIDDEMQLTNKGRELLYLGLRKRE
jgi:hypothetical protein